MVFIIESIIICALFTACVMIPLAKNPVGQIMSYPVEIRRRVESLPQYKDVIVHKEKKHLWIKVIFVLLIPGVMAAIAYLSGARTFKNALIYVFMLFMVINLYDTIVMDLGVFMHCKKFWIPGTEDMVKEYHNPRHHIVGACKGTLIGAVIALLSAGVVQLMIFIS